MIKWLLLPIWFLISFHNSYGADPYKLTKQESKDIARKASQVITRVENPLLERSLHRSLDQFPNYSSDYIIEERVKALERLAEVQPEEHIDEDLKTELMQWAIKELAERNEHEVTLKSCEEKKKWAAAALGLVSTILTVILPIVLSEDCDCSSDG